MHLFLYIVATLCVALTGLVITSKIQLQSVSDKILAIFIFSIAQMILSQLFLGVVLKRLAPYFLFALNGLLFAIILLIANKHELVNLIKRMLTHINYIINVIIKSPIMLLLSILAPLQMTYIVFVGYNFPPYGWDEIWYHLTTIASWTQQGWIGQLPEPSVWQDIQMVQSMTPYEIAYHMSIMGVWHNVYPMNAELVSMWSMIFLRNDMIVDLAQLPFSIMGMVSVYSISRKSYLPRKLSLLAGIIFIFTPILIIQSRTAYVDIAYGVLVLIAINFFIGFIKYKKNIYAYLCAISTGILLGIKSSGIMFAVFFSLMLFVIYYKNYTKKLAFKNTISIVLVIITLGGYWYFKNLYYYGNPIYPYTVSVGSFKIFNGLGSVTSLIMNHNLPNEYIKFNYFQRMFASWLETESYYSVDMRRAGFGPIWLILGLPSIFFSIIDAVYRKRKVYLITALVFVVFFMVHPTNWWTRYTIFIVGLGCVSLCYILNISKKILNGIVAASLLVLSIYTGILSSSYMVPFNIKEVMAVPIKQRTIGSTWYSDYQWVDKLTGTVIGYAPMTFTYPLFSGDFRNKVYLVDGNTKEEWINRMDERKVEYITFLKNYLHYEQWIKTSPEKFEQFYQGSTLLVYKVRR